MSEEWKPIPGYEGHYEVSSTGEVRSLRSRFGLRAEPRAVVPLVHPSGYLSVGLCKDAFVRRRRVHQLVLEAFVGPRPQGSETRHLNGKQADNRLENLTWGTKIENAKDKALHGTQTRGVTNNTAKLTEEQVYEIRASKESLSVLAGRYRVAKTNVSMIKNRVTWKHLPERKKS